MTLEMNSRWDPQTLRGNRFDFLRKGKAPVASLRGCRQKIDSADPVILEAERQDLMAPLADESIQGDGACR